MKIQIKKEHRQMEVLLHGELDHHGAKGLMQQLDQEIDANLPIRLTLNFKGVTFMDSSGIAAVIRCRRRMRELGGTVKLCTMSPQVRKVFEAAGVQRLVELD